MSSLPAVFPLNPKTPAGLNKFPRVNSIQSNRVPAPAPCAQLIVQSAGSLHYDIIVSAQKITKQHTVLEDHILNQCGDSVANAPVTVFISEHEHQADCYAVIHKSRTIAWVVDQTPESFKGLSRVKHECEYWIHMENFPGPHFSTPESLRSLKHILGGGVTDPLASKHEWEYWIHMGNFHEPDFPTLQSLQSLKHILGSGVTDALASKHEWEYWTHMEYFHKPDLSTPQGLQLLKHIPGSNAFTSEGSTMFSWLYARLRRCSRPWVGIAHTAEWRTFRVISRQGWQQVMCLSRDLSIASSVGRRSNCLFGLPFHAALLMALASALNAYYLIAGSQNLGDHAADASAYSREKEEISYGVQRIAIINATPWALLAWAFFLFVSLAKWIFNKSHARRGRCSGAWVDRIAYAKEWRKSRATNEQEWQRLMCLSCVLVIVMIIGRRSSCLFEVPAHTALLIVLALAPSAYYLLTYSQNFSDHGADAIGPEYWIHMENFPGPHFPTVEVLRSRMHVLEGDTIDAITSIETTSLISMRRIEMHLAMLNSFSGEEDIPQTYAITPGPLRDLVVQSLVINTHRTPREVHEGIIGTATSVEEIICALVRRRCPNLTPLIDLTTCSDHPYAIGGSCDVYRGRLYDGTRIALKLLRVYNVSLLQEEEGNRKMFKRAARELYHWSKLKHPNVHSLMGLAIFKGYISMVSGWMENGDLMSYLRLKPDTDRIQLCMDVCAGLCYIHMNGIVHGDLKATNILVSSYGAAVITDFGNAQLRNPTLKFTSTKNYGFSVRWTAPELLLDDGASQVSMEADIYAFGMTVLEVLTGKAPYEGLSEMRVIFLVAVEKKFPPRPNTRICDDLWQLLTSCWASVPSQRPRSMNIGDRLKALYPPPSTKCLLCQKRNKALRL